MSKVALVTGASSGFGLLTVLRLSRRPQIKKVYALVRSESRTQELLSELEKVRTASKVHIVYGDVTDPLAMQRVYQEVALESGRLDILVNNAGYGLGGFFEDISDAEFRAQMETNFFGVLAVSRLFLPLMRATFTQFKTRGRLIQVSSVSGRMAFLGVGAYCASKFALEGVSEALRYELRPMGIDVVLVEPGSYQTKIFDVNLRVAARSSDPNSPYFARTQRLLKLVKKQPRNPKPNQVALLIEKVAFMRWPGLRYLVGKDAHISNVLRAILPFRIFDWAMSRL